VAGRLPSPFDAGLRCVCPRCGEGRVFVGYLKVRSRCESCGLDLTFAQTTEGPAVFVIFVVGFIIVGAAALTEVAFHPHPLVHLAIWIPAILILSLALLPPFKATMIALHYRNIIHEGGGAG
jgi:uncharacterized protein (DUF983 family)